MTASVTLEVRVGEMSASYISLKVVTISRVVAPLLLALRALMNRYPNCSRCGDFKDLWLAGAQASCWLPASHPLRLTPGVTQNYLHPLVRIFIVYCGRVSSAANEASRCWQAPTDLLRNHIGCSKKFFVIKTEIIWRYFVLHDM